MNTREGCNEDNGSSKSTSNALCHSFNKLQVQKASKTCFYEDYLLAPTRLYLLQNDKVVPGIPKKLLDIIAGLKKFLREVPLHIRRSKQCIEDFYRMLLFLQEYVGRHVEVHKKYPLTKEVISLLVDYVELEYEVLYLSRCYSPEYQKQVENRIITYLLLFLYDRTKKKGSKRKNPIESSAINALHILKSIKPNYKREHDLVPNLMNKLLKKLNVLDTVNEFRKGNPDSTNAEKLLEIPRLQEISNQLQSCNYVKDLFESDDELEEIDIPRPMQVKAEQIEVKVNPCFKVEENLDNESDSKNFNVHSNNSNKCKCGHYNCSISCNDRIVYVSDDDDSSDVEITEQKPLPVFDLEDDELLNVNSASIIQTNVVMKKEIVSHSEELLNELDVIIKVDSTVTTSNNQQEQSVIDLIELDSCTEEDSEPLRLIEEKGCIVTENSNSEGVENNLNVDRNNASNKEVETTSESVTCIVNLKNDEKPNDNTVSNEEILTQTDKLLNKLDASTVTDQTNPNSETVQVTGSGPNEEQDSVDLDKCLEKNISVTVSANDDCLVDANDEDLTTANAQTTTKKLQLGESSEIAVENDKKNNEIEEVIEFITESSTNLPRQLKNSDSIDDTNLQTDISDIVNVNSRQFKNKLLVDELTKNLIDQLESAIKGSEKNSNQLHQTNVLQTDMPVVTEEAVNENVESEQISVITEETVNKHVELEDISVATEETVNKQVEFEQISVVTEETVNKHVELKQLSIATEEIVNKHVELEEISAVTEETVNKHDDPEQISVITEETDNEHIELEETSVVTEKTVNEDVKLQETSVVTEETVNKHVEFEEISFVTEETIDENVESVVTEETVNEQVESEQELVVTEETVNDLIELEEISVVTEETVNEHVESEEVVSYTFSQDVVQEEIVIEEVETMVLREEVVESLPESLSENFVDEETCEVFEPFQATILEEGLTPTYNYEVGSEVEIQDDNKNSATDELITQSSDCGVVDSEQMCQLDVQHHPDIENVTEFEPLEVREVTATNGTFTSDPRVLLSEESIKDNCLTSIEAEITIDLNVSEQLKVDETVTHEIIEAVNKQEKETDLLKDKNIEEEILLSKDTSEIPVEKSPNLTELNLFEQVQTLSSEKNHVSSTPEDYTPEEVQTATEPDKVFSTNLDVLANAASGHFQTADDFSSEPNSEFVTDCQLNTVEVIQEESTPVLEAENDLFESQTNPQSCEIEPKADEDISEQNCSNYLVVLATAAAKREKMESVLVKGRKMKKRGRKKKKEKQSTDDLPTRRITRSTTVSKLKISNNEPQDSSKCIPSTFMNLEDLVTPPPICVYNLIPSSITDEDSIDEPFSSVKNLQDILVRNVAYDEDTVDDQITLVSHEKEIDSEVIISIPESENDFPGINYDILNQTEEFAASTNLSLSTSEELCKELKLTMTKNKEVARLNSVDVQPIPSNDTQERLQLETTTSVSIDYQNKLNVQKTKKKTDEIHNVMPIKKRKNYARKNITASDVNDESTTGSSLENATNSLKTVEKITSDTVSEKISHLDEAPIIKKKSGVKLHKNKIVHDRPYPTKAALKCFQIPNVPCNPYVQLQKLPATCETQIVTEHKDCSKKPQSKIKNREKREPRSLSESKQKALESLKKQRKSRRSTIDCIADEDIAISKTRTGSQKLEDSKILRKKSKFSHEILMGIENDTKNEEIFEKEQLAIKPKTRKTHEDLDEKITMRTRSKSNRNKKDTDSKEPDHFINRESSPVDAVEESKNNLTNVATLKSDMKKEENETIFTKEIKTNSRKKGNKCEVPTRKNKDKSKSTKNTQSAQNTCDIQDAQETVKSINLELHTTKEEEISGRLDKVIDGLQPNNSLTKDNALNCENDENRINEDSKSVDLKSNTKNISASIKQNSTKTNYQIETETELVQSNEQSKIQDNSTTAEVTSESTDLQRCPNINDTASFETQLEKDSPKLEELKTVEKHSSIDDSSVKLVVTKKYTKSSKYMKRKKIKDNIMHERATINNDISKTPETQINLKAVKEDSHGNNEDEKINPNSDVQQLQNEDKTIEEVSSEQSQLETKELKPDKFQKESKTTDIYKKTYEETSKEVEPDSADDTQIKVLTKKSKMSSIKSKKLFSKRERPKKCEKKLKNKITSLIQEPKVLKGTDDHPEATDGNQKKRALIEAPIEVADKRQKKKDMTKQPKIKSKYKVRIESCKSNEHFYSEEPNFNNQVVVESKNLDVNENSFFHKEDVSLIPLPDEKPKVQMESKRETQISDKTKLEDSSDIQGNDQINVTVEETDEVSNIETEDIFLQEKTVSTVKTDEVLLPDTVSSKEVIIDHSLAPTEQEKPNLWTIDKIINSSESEKIPKVILSEDNILPEKSKLSNEKEKSLEGTNEPEILVEDKKLVTHEECKEANENLSEPNSTEHVDETDDKATERSTDGVNLEEKALDLSNTSVEKGDLNIGFLEEDVLDSSKPGNNTEDEFQTVHKLTEPLETDTSKLGESDIFKIANADNTCLNSTEFFEKEKAVEKSLLNIQILDELKSNGIENSDLVEETEIVEENKQYVVDETDMVVSHEESIITSEIFEDGLNSSSSETEDNFLPVETLPEDKCVETIAKATLERRYSIATDVYVSKEESNSKKITQTIIEKYDIACGPYKKPNKSVHIHDETIKSNDTTKVKTDVKLSDQEINEKGNQVNVKVDCKEEKILQIKSDEKEECITKTDDVKEERQSSDDDEVVLVSVEKLPQAKIQCQYYDDYSYDSEPMIDKLFEKYAKKKTKNNTDTESAYESGRKKMPNDKQVRFSIERNTVKRIVPFDAEEDKDIPNGSKKMKLEKERSKHKDKKNSKVKIKHDRNNILQIDKKKYYSKKPEYKPKDRKREHVLVAEKYTDEKKVDKVKSEDVSHKDEKSNLEVEIKDAKAEIQKQGKGSDRYNTPSKRKSNSDVLKKSCESSPKRNKFSNNSCEVSKRKQDNIELSSKKILELPKKIKNIEERTPEVVVKSLDQEIPKVKNLPMSASKKKSQAKLLEEQKLSKSKRLERACKSISDRIKSPSKKRHHKEFTKVSEIKPDIQEEKIAQEPQKKQSVENDSVGTLEDKRNSYISREFNTKENSVKPLTEETVEITVEEITKENIPRENNEVLSEGSVKMAVDDVTEKHVSNSSRLPEIVFTKGTVEEITEEHIPNENHFQERSEHNKNVLVEGSAETTIEEITKDNVTRENSEKVLADESVNITVEEMSESHTLDINHLQESSEKVLTEQSVKITTEEITKDNVTRENSENVLADESVNITVEEMSEKHPLDINHLQESSEQVLAEKSVKITIDNVTRENNEKVLADEGVEEMSEKHTLDINHLQESSDKVLAEEIVEMTDEETRVEEDVPNTNDFQEYSEKELMEVNVETTVKEIKIDENNEREIQQNVDKNVEENNESLEEIPADVEVNEVQVISSSCSIENTTSEPANTDECNKNLFDQYSSEENPKIFVEEVNDCVNENQDCAAEVDTEQQEHIETINVVIEKQDKTKKTIALKKSTDVKRKDCKRIDFIIESLKNKTYPKGNAENFITLITNDKIDHEEHVESTIRPDNFFVEASVHQSNALETEIVQNDLDKTDEVETFFPEFELDQSKLQEMSTEESQCEDIFPYMEDSKKDDCLLEIDSNENAIEIATSLAENSVSLLDVGDKPVDSAEASTSCEITDNLIAVMFSEQNRSNKTGFIFFKGSDHNYHSMGDPLLGGECDANESDHSSDNKEIPSPELENVLVNDTILPYISTLTDNHQESSEDSGADFQLLELIGNTLARESSPPLAQTITCDTLYPANLKQVELEYDESSTPNSEVFINQFQQQTMTVESMSDLMNVVLTSLKNLNNMTKPIQQDSNSKEGLFMPSELDLNDVIQHSQPENLDLSCDFSQTQTPDLSSECSTSNTPIPETDFSNLHFIPVSYASAIEDSPPKKVIVEHIPQYTEEAVKEIPPVEVIVNTPPTPVKLTTYRPKLSEAIAMAKQNSAASQAKKPLNNVGFVRNSSKTKPSAPKPKRINDLKKDSKEGTEEVDPPIKLKSIEPLTSTSVPNNFTSSPPKERSLPIIDDLTLSVKKPDVKINKMKEDEHNIRPKQSPAYTKSPRTPRQPDQKLESNEFAEALSQSDMIDNVKRRKRKPVDYSSIEKLLENDEYDFPKAQKSKNKKDDRVKTKQKEDEPKVKKPKVIDDCIPSTSSVNEQSKSSIFEDSDDDIPKKKKSKPEPPLEAEAMNALFDKLVKEGDVNKVTKTNVTKVSQDPPRQPATSIFSVDSALQKKSETTPVKQIGVVNPIPRQSNHVRKEVLPSRSSYGPGEESRTSSQYYPYYPDRSRRSYPYSNREGRDLRPSSHQGSSRRTEYSTHPNDQRYSSQRSSSSSRSSRNSRHHSNSRSSTEQRDYWFGAGSDLSWREDMKKKFPNVFKDDFF